MSGAKAAVDYISRSEAITEIARLVAAQSEAFQAQALQTAALNDEIRTLPANFRAEVTQAGTELREETLGWKATADAQTTSLHEELALRSRSSLTIRRTSKKMCPSERPSSRPLRKIWPNLRRAFANSRMSLDPR